MLDLKSYSLSKKESVIFYICVIISGLILSILFYQNILFSLIIIPFIGILKKTVEDTINKRRRREVLMEFKDCLFSISTSIGAGRSMKDAIRESIPSIIDIYGESALLATELNTIYQRIEQGENDVKVLMEFAVYCGLEDIIDFVNIYSICKQSGANLIAALNMAANVIIEKMTIEKEVQEISRRKEREGLILLIMPVIVIMFLNISSPEYIAPLYQTIAGRLIMTLVIAGNIGVYFLVKRITSIEI